LRKISLTLSALHQGCLLLIILLLLLMLLLLLLLLCLYPMRMMMQ
jgi:hypothetical protein